METPADLIKSVMSVKTWTPAQLAARLGIKERTLKRVISGEFPLSPPIAAHLKTIRADALPNLGNDEELSDPNLGEDSPEYRLTINRVPVLSWAHAGEAESYEELPKSWQESVPSTCGDRSAFALTIEGDSMQPKYETGDIVIVMPSIKPRNGCLVVAKFKSDGIVFRRFHVSPVGNMRLTAYNSIYPEYEGPETDFHWIYPVHSTLKNEWRV